LLAWLAPVGTVAQARREDEAYRRHITQQATQIWETDTGEAVAFALIPSTTSLGWCILPKFRTTAHMRAILAWGYGHLRDEGRYPFLMVRCHEADQDLRTAVDQEGFAPDPYQDVYLHCFLTSALVTPALPAGFRLQAGVTVAEHAHYQQLHQAIFDGANMGMDEHFSSAYQPDLGLIAIAADGTWAGFCFCTLDQVADALDIEQVGDIGVLGVHPAFRRQGLGRALLRLSMQRAQQRGMPRLVLETENELSPAMQLYRSVGFHPGSPWRWWRKSV